MYFGRDLFVFFLFCFLSVHLFPAPLPNDSGNYIIVWLRPSVAECERGKRLIISRIFTDRSRLVGRRYQQYNAIYGLLAVGDDRRGCSLISLSRRYYYFFFFIYINLYLNEKIAFRLGQINITAKRIRCLYPDVK